MLLHFMCALCQSLSKISAVRNVSITMIRVIRIDAHRARRLYRIHAHSIAGVTSSAVYSSSWLFRVLQAVSGCFQQIRKQLRMWRHIRPLSWWCIAIKCFHVKEEPCGADKATESFQHQEPTVKEIPVTSPRCVTEIYSQHELPPCLSPIKLDRLGLYMCHNLGSHAEANEGEENGHRSAESNLLAKHGTTWMYRI